jgi:LacI family transcriptional regulator
MTRKVSMKDVAASAGVSLGTVSNVLNRPELVADETRQRVQDVIDDLGFVRNAFARQLRAGRSDVVGLIVFDIANPFFADVAKAAASSLQEAGLALVVCDSDRDEAKERQYLELLEEQRVHGILIAPTGVSSDHIRQVQQRGTPVVLVDRAGKLTYGSSVAVDDVAGGESVMRHLQTMGHDRIAFVGGPMWLPQVRDRHKGLTRNGSVDVLETPGLGIEHGRDVAEALLRRSLRSRPTALACANDLLAIGVMQVLLERGVRVPQDIALVGYDDIEFAAASAVALSSVRQPRAELGRSAAEMLVAGKPHRSALLRPSLVVRASSDLRRRRRSPSRTD